MNIRKLISFIIVVLLIGCTAKDEEQTVTRLNDLEYQVVATGLKIPWEIAKVNDTIYISERVGSIVEIGDNKMTRRNVALEQNLSSQPEAGLLGIAFPEEFNDKAYAYYSYVDNNDYFQRVVEIQKDESNWRETKTLLDRIPGGKYHQGGRIEIGPDNKLYITTGDATIPELAQDVTSLAGKILRMNLDGSIPEDNPFENNYIYSYGHRNPQGLAWDNEGRLYATEHGASAHDELNLIQKGSNYGWPTIQGDEMQTGMVTPIIHSSTDTWAPSGLTFLDGKLYFAALRGEGIRVLDRDTGILETILPEIGRARDVLATENGIYVITNNTDGRGNPSPNDDQLLFVPIEYLTMMPE